MDAATYRALVDSIPFGKRLPTAVYVHVDGITALPGALISLLVKIQRNFALSSDLFHVIKFHRQDFSLSLLSYPDFDTNPHPALVAAISIHLGTGILERRNYSASSNPPILHRKECFLPSDDPRTLVWHALTMAEEAAGLFDETSTIGTKHGWESALTARGLTLVGHSLSGANEAIDAPPLTANTLSSQRWKTAISRFGLSAPVQAMLKFGLCTIDDVLLDYGCGQGDDVRGLLALKYRITGWDPHFAPETPPEQADVVNLGFVINVIDDPVERAQTIRQSFALARRALVVSAMLTRERYLEDTEPYGDGVVTRLGTFQKYYEQGELSDYVEQCTEREPIAAGPGIFFAFQNPEERQAFLAKRTRQPINFALLSARIFADKPRTQAGSTYDQQLRLVDAHRDLFDDFWQILTRMGRLPKADEFPRFPELNALGLSPMQARTLYVRLYGEGAIERAFLETHRELIESCWLAMEKHGRRLRPGEFDREEELNKIGISLASVHYQYLREHGPDALLDGFIRCHQELLDDAWNILVDLGRLPKPSEYPKLAELQLIGLSPTKVHELFLRRFGQETLDQARDIRRKDLLVFFALANLKKKVTAKDLPRRLRNDLEVFFAGFSKAMIEAQEHLHMAAKSEVIAKLCNDTPFGVIDDQALYCHTALIPRLHPVLRIYVGCAELLHGDLADADLIKIHKRSGKLTLLYYNSFENRRLPVLQRRVKILLKGQRLQDFDHTTGEEQQILYNKELYVADDHPKRAAWSAWSQRLESIVGPIQGRGPSKERMGSILKEYGYDIQLRRPNAERAKSSVSDDEEM